MKKVFAIILCCLCLSSFLSSQPNGNLKALLDGMNDHLKARQSLQPAVITAPPAKALEFAPRTIQGAKGPSYIFVNKADNIFDVVFASNPAGEPPTRGDFVIRRGIKPNAVKSVKLVLADGGGTYVLLEPYTNDRTYLKLVSGGETLYSRVVLAAPIYSLYARSAEYIINLAGSKVDWETALAPVDPAGQEASLSQAAALSPGASPSPGSSPVPSGSPDFLGGNE